MSKLATRKPAPIIPPQAGSLRSLTVTMAVMCYLACLAIGALILINRAVDNWTSGLSREITVQVRELQQSDIEAELAKAAEILKNKPRVMRDEVLKNDAGDADPAVPVDARAAGPVHPDVGAVAPDTGAEPEFRVLGR